MVEVMVLDYVSVIKVLSQCGVRDGLKGRFLELFLNWVVDSIRFGDFWMWGARERVESDMIQFVFSVEILCGDFCNLVSRRFFQGTIWQYGEEKIRRLSLRRFGFEF